MARLLPVCLILLLLAGPIPCRSESQAHEEMTAPRPRVALYLAAGDIGGPYYPFGMGMATNWSTQLGPEAAIQVRSITSEGGPASLRLLKENRAQLAIVPACLACLARGEEGASGDRPYPGLRGVATLPPITQELFITTAEHAPTGTLADLKGLKVNLGPPESGLVSRAGHILPAAGINLQDLTTSGLDYFRAARALKEGRVEAVYLPGFLGVGAVQSIFAAAGQGFRPVLLGFDQEQIIQINNSSPYLGFPHTIPAGTLPGQEREVVVMAQPSLLVCRADLDGKVVEQLLKVLFEKQYMFQLGDQTDTQSSADRAIWGMNLPLHPAALAYYQGRGMVVPPHLVPPESRDAKEGR